MVLFEGTLFSPNGSSVLRWEFRCTTMPRCVLSIMNTMTAMDQGMYPQMPLTNGLSEYGASSCLQFAL